MANPWLHFHKLIPNLILRAILLVSLVPLLSSKICALPSEPYQPSGLDTDTSLPAPHLSEQVLFRDSTLYCAFPRLRQDSEDRLWVHFQTNTVASHYGKAAGGHAEDKTLYSPDGGKTWIRDDEMGFVPTPDSLFGLPASNGRRVSVSPLMHEPLTLLEAGRLATQGVRITTPRRGHPSASYRVQCVLRTPGQKTRSYFVDLPRLSLIGGNGNGCRLGDGSILFPLYGYATLQDSVYRTWVLRSTNDGESWTLHSLAFDGIHPFGEPTLIALGGDSVLAVFRSTNSDHRVSLKQQGFLWQSLSIDGGLYWSVPERTDIWGFPPNLIETSNGDLLCTYGYRRPPYGIRASFSHDRGTTWDSRDEAVLRWDGLALDNGNVAGSIADLGYPQTVQLNDGDFFTVYYFNRGDGITYIAGTRWSPGYRGPAVLPRGLAAASAPDSAMQPEAITATWTPLELGYALYQSFVPIKPEISAIAIRIDSASYSPELVHERGLSIAIRRAARKNWTSSLIGQTPFISPDQLTAPGWHTFEFAAPIQVVPGELYVLTIYNGDFSFIRKLVQGLTGNHSWYISATRGWHDIYPLGGIDRNLETDLGFKVYSTSGALPSP